MDRSKWEYKKLGDICDKGSSNIAQNKIEDITGEYPLYGASGYVKGINFYHQEKPYIGIVKDGSGVGRANLYPAKSSLLGTMQYIIPKDVCELGFLLYVIKGLHLEKYKTGAAIPHIYFKDYAKSIVPFPPIEDQQRIVAELDCLNEMIALKQEQLKEFDKLAQSIFYDMFGEGYNTKFLGEFCEVGTGATPDRKKVAIYYGGNVNWVKTTEVHNCDIYETEERITDIALEQTNCKVYYPGAILMAMYGQGKTRGQVARLMTKAATNQACAAIIPDTRICDKDYLYIYLLLSYEKIRNMARGGNQANLNLSLVKMIPVPLPPLALQQQFAEKIQAIEAQKELVKQSIAETQHLFDSRMDYYFN